MINPRLSTAARQIAANAQRPQGTARKAAVVGSLWGDNSSTVQVQVNGEQVQAETTMDAPIVPGDEVYVVRAQNGKWLAQGTA